MREQLLQAMIENPTLEVVSLVGAGNSTMFEWHQATTNIKVERLWQVENDEDFGKLGLVNEGMLRDKISGWIYYNTDLSGEEYDRAVDVEFERAKKEYPNNDYIVIYSNAWF